MYIDDRIEQFDVIGANKTIRLESNRPLIRNYSKTRRPDWKMIAGKVESSSGLADIEAEILKVVDKT